MVFFFLKHKIYDGMNLNKIYQIHMNHHVHYHNFRISYFYLYLSVVAATFLFTLKLKNLYPNLLAATMSKDTENGRTSGIRTHRSPRS